MTDSNLPAIYESTLPAIEQLTKALGVPREFLASNDEIQFAWRDLPRELRRVPVELRNELLGRMCIAVATGLFDGAINYAWNASILQLRQKIRDFGLNVVSQIIGKDFDESALIEIKDAELLSLCLKLNLINEKGFFFLDQCRDIRNNFSAAHPSVALLDDREFITFLSRCAKYALSSTRNPRGIEITAFISATKGARFSKTQLGTWLERISNTHDAQRELFFGMLHGIYCDPSSSEEARLNSLDICQMAVENFTPQIKSDLIDRHYDYLSKGDVPRHKASQEFFEKLCLLNLLNEGEMHAFISDACKKLLSVHQAWDNFYNEPPFAQRLFEIVSQTKRPETVKQEYVLVVTTCFVGNPYGVSIAAVPFYEKMIKSFTPKEINFLLISPKANTILASRIKTCTNCKNRFKKAVALIDPKSIQPTMQTAYLEWTS